MTALVARVPFAPEDAGWLAREYAANGYFESSLRAALDRRKAGALYVAWTLIDSGDRLFLPEAQQAGRQLTATPAEANPTHAQKLDRDAAARLLRQ